MNAHKTTYANASIPPGSPTQWVYHQANAYAIRNITTTNLLLDANASNMPKSTLYGQLEASIYTHARLTDILVPTCRQTNRRSATNIGSNGYTQNSRGVDFDNPFIQANIPSSLSFVPDVPRSRQHTRMLRFYFSLRVHWRNSLSGHVGVCSSAAPPCALLT